MFLKHLRLHAFTASVSKSRARAHTHEYSIVLLAELHERKRRASHEQRATPSGETIGQGSDRCSTAIAEPVDAGDRAPSVSSSLSEKRRLRHGGDDCCVLCMHIYVHITFLPSYVSYHEHCCQRTLTRARKHKYRVCSQRKLFFTWCSTPTSEVHPTEVLQRLHQWLLVGSSTVHPWSPVPSRRCDGRRMQQLWTGLVVMLRGAAIF